VFRLSKALWNECKEREAKNIEKLEAKTDEYCRHKLMLDHSLTVDPSACSRCGISKTCNRCRSIHYGEDTSEGKSNVSAKRGRKRRLSDDKLTFQSLLPFLLKTRDKFPPETLQSPVISQEYEHYVGAIPSLSYGDLLNHLISVRVEYVQRYMRPIVQKLMSHNRNGDVYNHPVDPVALGLVDYFKVIPNPMDLGTVKTRLLQGYYHTIESCADDISLVFRNATVYNHPDHIVHQCAKQLNNEFQEDLKSLRERLNKEEERKAHHTCGTCLGSSCVLCGEKCLKFEPAILVCYGTCSQRIKRNATYYVALDGAMLWCQKCYTGSGPVMVESAGPEHKPLLKKDLIKRRFDEEVVEPWVECSTCLRRVHQVCGLYNRLHDESEVEEAGGKGRAFQCPLCKLEAIGATPNAPSGHVTEAGVVKRLRAESVEGRGERVRRRANRQDLEERRQIDSTPVTEVQTDYDRSSSDDSEHEQTCFDDEEGSVPVVKTIPSQHTGASDTSHEADGGMEEDDEDEVRSLSSLGLSSDVEPVRACDQWRASSLPRTRLSDFLEAMVEERLRQCGEKDLMESLTIRMTSNCMHNFEVPDVITDNLPNAHGNRVQQYFMYKQKCILLFQRIDGIDVCLFCLYVQEFDERCPEPNRSKVYIAYLDSVEYFRPRSLRTTVYHEILVAYLKWSQARGFKQGHIWACPPQRGDNFIFWCHNPQQRTPSRDRLNAWYNVMLNRSCALGILSSVDTLWSAYFAAYGKRDELSQRAASKNSFVSRNSTALAAKRGEVDTPGVSTLDSVPPICPPVFEGDFWVTECSRVYRMVQTRTRGKDGQDRQVNQRQCREILKLMMARPTAEPFNHPVDIKLLNIPDYPLIITRPMDLGTVKEKLRAGGYRSVLDYANDIRLTFNNAMTYNPYMHIIHMNAKKLLEDFEVSLVDMVRERVGDMFAETADTDRWLETYPLNNEMEWEKQSAKEKHEAELMARARSAGTAATDAVVASTGAEPNRALTATTLCETRRVCFGDKFGAEHQETVEHQEEGKVEAYRSFSLGCESDFGDSAPPLRRQESTESVLSVTEHWPRRPTHSTAQVCPVGQAQVLASAEIPFEKPRLGQKGVFTLMQELSRNVCRLKDDMYVITFADMSSDTAGVNHSDNSVGSVATFREGGKGKGKGKGYSCAPQVKAEHGTLSDKCLRMLEDIAPDTSDPDDIIRSPFSDSRQTFLEMSQYRHFQFDSLRRAKHSSAILIYHLLNPHARHVRPICSECGGTIREVRWHCNQCVTNDYDVCNLCLPISNGRHEHNELTPVRVSFL